MKKLTKALAIAGVAALATSSLAFSACSNKIDYENVAYQVSEFSYKAVQAEKVQATLTVNSTTKYDSSYAYNDEHEVKSVPGYTENGTSTMDFSHLVTKSGPIGDIKTVTSMETVGHGDEDGTKTYELSSYLRGDAVYAVEQGVDGDDKEVSVVVAQTNVEEDLRDAKKNFKEGILAIFQTVTKYVSEASEFVLDGEEWKSVNELKEGASYTMYNNLAFKCTASKLVVSGTQTKIHKGFRYEQGDYLYGESHYRNYTAESTFTFECNIKAKIKEDSFATDVVPSAVAGEVRYYMVDDVNAIAADFVANKAISLAPTGNGALIYKNAGEEESNEAVSLSMISVGYEYDGEEKTMNIYGYDFKDYIEMTDGTIKFAANAYTELLAKVESRLSNSYGEGFAKSALTVTDVTIVISYGRLLHQGTDEAPAYSEFSSMSSISFKVND